MNKKIGYVGLGKMGHNMVLRLLDHGWEVTAFDTAPGAVAEIAGAGAQGSASIKNLIEELPTPRLIWIMVPHKAVDTVLKELVPRLGKGDIVIEFYSLDEFDRLLEILTSTAKYH